MILLLLLLFVMYVFIANNDNCHNLSTHHLPDSVVGTNFI